MLNFKINILRFGKISTSILNLVHDIILMDGKWINTKVLNVFSNHL